MTFKLDVSNFPWFYSVLLHLLGKAFLLNFAELSSTQKEAHFLWLSHLYRWETADQSILSGAGEESCEVSKPL